jgi:hypothetical protein
MASLTDLERRIITPPARPRHLVLPRTVEVAGAEQMKAAAEDYYMV